MTRKQKQLFSAKGHRRGAGSSSQESSSVEHSKKRKGTQFKKQYKKRKTNATDNPSNEESGKFPTVEDANSLYNSVRTPDKHKSPRYHTKRYPWEMFTPKRRNRKCGRRLFQCLDNFSSQLYGMTTSNKAGETLLSYTDEEHEMNVEGAEFQVDTSASEAPVADTSPTVSSSVAEEIAPPQVIRLLTEAYIPDATNTCGESLHSCPLGGVQSCPDQCNLGTRTSSPNQVRTVGSGSGGNIGQPNAGGFGGIGGGSGGGPSKRNVGIQCRVFTVDKINQYDSPVYSFQNLAIRLKPKDFRFFTGVTQETFEEIYSFIGGDEVCNNLKYSKKDGTPRRRPLTQLIDSKGRLFMTLIRLRRGMPLRDLALMFHVSVGLASSIVYTWIRFLSLQFQILLDKMFLSRDEQNVNKPAVFKPFPNVRSIIDCTDFHTQKPFNFQMQSNLYSPYKSSTRLKYLIGDTVFGGTGFISKGVEGSCSDKEMVTKSGFLDHLVPGDGVMTDRGFDIEAELNAKDVDLIMPARRGKRKAFTAAEVKQSRDIAKARVIIEITNKRIKDFRILRGTIPNKLLPIMDDMVLICAILSQFDPPFIDRKRLIKAIKSLKS